uniref:Uncharacterized protein n=1 Tax=Oryza sativa subsp. japonica TaxID=39947 RepID=Q9FRD0_ORYSJ|nr:hypothetical protein [Oryza sativa Japonica Group]
MRRRWAALRRALDSAGGRTQLGAVGRRQAVAEAARGHWLALSDGGGGEQDEEDAPVKGGGGATAAPLPLLHLDPVSSIRGKATARPPPWAPSAHAASPCAKLAAHPSAELVARGRGWGEDVVGGGGRGGKEGAKTTKSRCPVAKFAVVETFTAEHMATGCRDRKVRSEDVRLLLYLGASSPRFFFI